MTSLLRRTLCAAVLAAALPHAAGAAPVDDYIVARDKAISAALAAAKAGKGSDDATIKAEETALRDLGKRMAGLVGPLRFKGLGNPAYTLHAFIYGDDTPTTQLDGMSFANKNETVFGVVSPEPVFQAWLAARAKDKDAPAGVADGPKAAVDSAYLVNNSVMHLGGGYVPFVSLPVAAAPGETAFANLGLFTDEAPADSPPNSIVVLRVADGRAILGLTRVELDLKPVAACTQVWKPYAVKVQAMLKDAETASDLEDPRWDALAKVGEEGSAAFRACFIKAPEVQAALANATKRADSFLQTLRGQ